MKMVEGALSLDGEHEHNWGAYCPCAMPKTAPLFLPFSLSSYPRSLIFSKRLLSGMLWGAVQEWAKGRAPDSAALCEKFAFSFLTQVQRMQYFHRILSQSGTLSSAFSLAFEQLKFKLALGSCGLLIPVVLCGSQKNLHAKVSGITVALLQKGEKLPSGGAGSMSIHRV